MYMYIQTYTHTHTHTHIYIYIYIVFQRHEAKQKEQRNQKTTQKNYASPLLKKPSTDDVIFYLWYKIEKGLEDDDDGDINCN